MSDMPDIPIYPGSSSFTTGSTPFGFYDSENSFQLDADKVALHCARRLGYPIVDVELQDVNFYAAFEEAITTYGNEVYAYKVRQDYLSLEGYTTTSSINKTLIHQNLNSIIEMSKQYGSEAGVGGNVDWRMGNVNLTSSLQTYDLEAWAVGEGIEENDIEIKRIFYEDLPANMHALDPYVGSIGGMNSLESFGFTGGSPASTYMLMPLNYDLARIQAIEMSQQVRRSNFSFEIQNNKLRIFPIPNRPGKLYFQYILKSERTANTLITPNKDVITNVSNVPYNNPVYSDINAIGKSWIVEFTLAICKEILGYIRGKYQTIPIPDDSVTLNHGDLISSAKSDKEALVEKLKLYLLDTSREKLLERRSLETDYRKKELAEVPNVIYIG